ncbi:hypothetical protein [Haliscomenobacter sp.]|uniref:hypothetical protein n=1 Tax=Haliscomenobacter sp. TaxID=2717303 RepID=UPI003BAA13E6
MKRILLASAQVNTNKEYLDHLKEERDGIGRVLNDSIKKGKIALQQEKECTFEGLFDNFNAPDTKDKEINVFHYCGHSDGEQLYLQQDGAGNRMLSNQNLVNFFKYQKKLELVFLNSCSSETLGEMLLAECDHIQAVIETTSKISDLTAAKFAEKFYQSLHAGKNLKLAFDQTVDSFADIKSVGYRSVEKGRSIVKWDDHEESTWTLSFKEDTFVDNWYLVERPIQRYFEPSIKTKILVIVEDSNENDKYYRLIDNLFLQDQGVLILPFSDILLEDQKEELVANVEQVIILLTEETIAFFKRFEWLIPLLTKAPLLFLGCTGDTAKTFTQIASQLERDDAPIFPSPRSSLERLSEVYGLEFAFNDFCAQFITKSIRSREATLASELEDLNFTKQRLPFESKDEELSFRFGKHNLMLIEGSPNCAQELLVKKLRRYANPRVSSNVKPDVVSVKSYLPGKLTKEDLCRMLTHTLLSVDLDLGIELIGKTILQKTMQQDLIIVLNDISKNHGDCLSVIKNFWNELTLHLQETKHRLFLFFIHKECQDSQKNWTTQGFVNQPPLFNVRSLDLIEPLNEQIWNGWHASTGKRFPKEDLFHSLIQEEKSQQILRDPYMAKAIAKICDLMKCPEICKKLLTI